jgi:hypothetical protein
MQPHPTQSGGFSRVGSSSVWTVVVIVAAFAFCGVAVAMMMSSRPSRSVPTGFVNPYSANTFANASAQSAFVPVPTDGTNPSTGFTGTEIPVGPVNRRNVSTPAPGIITPRVVLPGTQPVRSALFGPPFHQQNIPMYTPAYPSPGVSIRVGSLGSTMH